jgi:hypothetical protein
MPLTSSGILQAATVIAKTTPTLIGAEIPCRGFEKITLFFTYTKGDETGLNIYPNLMRTAGGTAHELRLWSETGGVYTAEQVKYQVTATGNYSVTLDVSGVEYIKFMQGGSNNDGTPTGTLAASYTLETV